jgi:ribA/ribD-fused uncharacterized protein
MKRAPLTVPHDGHCLFAAVALTLFGSGDPGAVQEIRTRLLAWLATHFDHQVQAALPSRPSLRRLTQQLTCPTALAPEANWGNVDTLCLIARVLNVAFLVLKLSPSAGSPHELIGAEEHAPRHVLMWDHNNQHYYATAAEVGDSRRPEVSRHYRYFYDPLSEDGFLSNHFQKEVAFRTAGGECCRAKSSEHLFMYLKALVFGDLGAAESILQAPTPQAAKQAARRIAPFVQFTWDCNKRETMLQALRLKFAFDSTEADALVATHPAMLAEAAPSDLVWGIGLSTEEAQAGAAWRGANVLGHCLMLRRWELMAQASDTAPGASDTASLTLQDVKPSDANAAADRLRTGKRSNTPKAEPQRRDEGAAFTYVDVFAGTSAFTEKALALRGEAIGFVESDTSDHPLLHALCPSAWIASDLYGDEWQTQHYRAADALLAWPMCKHLAACGLGRMQHDEVASQLWDIAPLAEYFNVKLVAIEKLAVARMAGPRTWASGARLARLRGAWIQPRGSLAFARHKTRRRNVAPATVDPSGAH